jgi:hypothetical protein
VSDAVKSDVLLPAEVRARVLALLQDDATDQVVCVIGQGTDVKINVAVPPHTYPVWSRVLRLIADEMDQGTTLISSMQKKMN